MRSYSTKLVALALDIEPKWLDNLLTRTELPGVSKAKQGIARRITDDGVLAIEICGLLNDAFGVSIDRASVIARAAIDCRSPQFEYVAAGGMSLRMPLDEMRARLRVLLADAVQSLPRTRRGRPSRDRPDVID